jgi:hypothetical protein
MLKVSMGAKREFKQNVKREEDGGYKVERE